MFESEGQFREKTTYKEALRDLDNNLMKLLETVKREIKLNREKIQLHITETRTDRHRGKPDKLK